jgi:hypothetical protein
MQYAHTAGNGSLTNQRTSLISYPSFLMAFLTLLTLPAPVKDLSKGDTWAQLVYLLQKRDALPVAQAQLTIIQ